LIEAFARLAGRGVSCVGVIAGDGPLRAALEARAAALGLSDRVRFLGHCLDVERVFAALDIFVLSSTSEGLSNTILEAMATGLPVVATRVGGADELVDVGRTGLLVPPADADALAGALEDLVAQEARRTSMGSAGRHVADERFGVDRMLRDYTNLYCRIEPRATGLRLAPIGNRSAVQ
jgi:glycosyltransferase involved in cell wall biosynthesis